MRKKTLAMLLALVMTASLAVTGCGAKEAEAPAPAATEEAAPAEAEPTVEEAAPEAEVEEPAAEEAAVVEDMGPLLMATTTSTDNTGLLDYLAPIFKEDTGYDLQWTSVGTGAALQMGMDGEVDVVLVHSKAKEEAFVADGYGVERVQVMFNDFVIVGPKDGAVAKSEDIEAVFKQIKDESLTFVSRGDDSGTHTKETGIWGKIGIEDYESNPNYLSAGAGMGDTLIMANEKGGYCLADRGTWLAKRGDFPDMDIVCEGDSNLLNQYGVIAVNPEKFADTNIDGANVFIEWICSEEIQKTIGEFGVAEYGEPLFTPNAE